MGRRLQSLASALTGAVTAAGVMYYFDGSSGRKRRARLGERSAQAARSFAQRLSERAAGWIRGGRVPAGVLAARVRARVERIVTHAQAVHVSVDEAGSVRLTGAVLAWELEPLRASVAAVPGIGRVVAELAVLESAERVRALVGDREVPTRPQTPTEASTAVRLLMALAGSGLLLGGARRRGKLGAASAAAGGMLLLRSVAPSRARLRRQHRPSIELSHTLHVHAPVNSVYTALRQPEALVGAVPPVRALRSREDGAMRWTLSDSEGWRLECIGEISEVQPNREIAWRSTADSPVSLWGMVWLEPIDERQTRLQLYISCRGAPGRTGAALRSLAGVGAREQLTENLNCLRQYLEAGAAPPPVSRQGTDVLSAWTQPPSGRTH